MMKIIKKNYLSRVPQVNTNKLFSILNKFLAAKLLGSQRDLSRDLGMDLAEI